MTVLAHTNASFLVHRRCSGLEPAPLGLVPERWWVEPDSRPHDESSAFRR